MVDALHPIRLTAPDIAGAAGDAGEAADAASFASLLGAHGVHGDGRGSTDAVSGDDDRSTDDDPSRVNDAAFLVLMLADQRPDVSKVNASGGDVPQSSSPAQATGGDAGETAATDGAKPRPFIQLQLTARKQILDVQDAVAGEEPTPAPEESSLDAAAIAARRAVDAAWNAQVTQDRSATRAALDQARPPVLGESGASRIGALASAANEMFSGFLNTRGDGGNADAGANAGPGSPFAPARSASAIAGLRPLHTLVPVAFEVARDGSPSSAATTAAASALPNEDGVTTSIVQALRLQVTAGGGSATINLDPSYLGGVRVAVQVTDGSVTATLHAANPQVRAWMEANESSLRQALLDQGLTLDRLVVAEDHGADLQRDPNPQYSTPDEQPQARQRRRDTGERFEVIA